jgi:hypothetical protein
VDYQSSPKKRKAQGAHTPAPPPAPPSHTSEPGSSQPRSSAGRRSVGGGHTRNRSEASSLSGQESDQVPGRESSSQGDRATSRPAGESGDPSGNWSGQNRGFAGDSGREAEKRDSVSSTQRWYRGEPDARRAGEDGHISGRVRNEGDSRPASTVPAADRPTNTPKSGSPRPDDGYRRRDDHPPGAPSSNFGPSENSKTATESAPQ